MMITRNQRCFILFERTVTPERIFATRLTIDGQIQASQCLQLPDTVVFDRLTEFTMPQHSYKWVILWSYSDTSGIILQTQYNP